MAKAALPVECASVPVMLEWTGGTAAAPGTGAGGLAAGADLVALAADVEAAGVPRDEPGWPAPSVAEGGGGGVLVAAVPDLGAASTGMPSAAKDGAELPPVAGPLADSPAALLASELAGGLADADPDNMLDGTGEGQPGSGAEFEPTLAAVPLAEGIGGGRVGGPERLADGAGGKAGVALAAACGSAGGCVLPAACADPPAGSPAGLALSRVGLTLSSAGLTWS